MVYANFLHRSWSESWSGSKSGSNTGFRSGSRSESLSRSRPGSESKTGLWSWSWSRSESWPWSRSWSGRDFSDIFRDQTTLINNCKPINLPLLLGDITDPDALVYYEHVLRGIICQKSL